MKSLTRVVILLASLLFVQCSSIEPKPEPSIIRTIQTNTNSAIAIELNSLTKGNGVILTCLMGTCIVLTAAHLCNPFIIIDNLLQQANEGEISVAEGGRYFSLYSKLLKEKSFCKGFVVLEDETRVPVRPVLINFEHDLMLGVVQLPDRKSTVHLSTVKKVEPGTRLYTAVVAPTTDRKIILFSRAGVTKKTFLTSDVEKKDGQVYLQTNFPIGPGASGAPVFLADTNLLVGVICAQMIDGNPLVPIKATYVATPNQIREVYLQHTEDKDDIELNRPYCHGKKYLCELVRGEISIVDAFRHRRNEKESTETQPSRVPPGNSRGRGVDSPDAGSTGEQ